MGVTDIELYCGFCGHQDTYKKRTVGEKGRVSDTICCNKCHKDLNHKNKVK